MTAVNRLSYMSSLAASPEFAHAPFELLAFVFGFGTALAAVFAANLSIPHTVSISFTTRSNPPNSCRGHST
ncbi:hypothetical protein B0H10DRAFT_1998547 [Mycena sp. CBHHK59/15]|nr:hypothetical protein B0H10DRAFT_1998547 [Mycena sp. CBHHK59/15]